MNSVNYVIATYLGERRNCKNPLKMLEYHLAKLCVLKHNLSQVTIMVNEHESSDFEKIKEAVRLFEPTKFPIVVLKKENWGLSYACFQEVYDLYKNQFSHYIFMEDDYVPVIDNFDQIFLDELDKKPAKTFLCQVALKTGHLSVITNGIVSSETLAELTDNGKVRLYADTNDHYSNNHQITFRDKFRLTKGFHIEGLQDKYKTLAPDAEDGIREYGTGELFIMPIQLLCSDS